jgi:hypothetical protein
VRARRDGEAGPRAMVASAEADKAAPPGRARGRGSRAGPDGAMAGERKEGGKGERREGLTARRGRTASRERETCVGGKGRGEREIKEDAVWGESGADGRAPPRGGGGGGCAHACGACRTRRGGWGGWAAAAPIGPKAGVGHAGGGKEEGWGWAARLAGTHGAHDGEGRGAGWAAAGSRPKKGEEREREIPLFYSIF